MGLFDSLKKVTSNANAISAAASALPKSSGKTVEVVFPNLPETLEQFKALPQAQLTSAFDTAALTVLALCFYPQNKELSIEMLNFLKGPNSLNPAELQFLRDRFMDKDYVPRSYFVGATPANDYQPSQPYTIKVSENPYSYTQENYAQLYMSSGGADSPRYVRLRLAKDGKWYLWEQFILSDIRKPESTNPWA
ncbi:MAG: hypothetical protein IKO47_13200 [Ruminococcus sp.]|nr:hypothetical protein [Ruminococcus sp.]